MQSGLLQFISSSQELYARIDTYAHPTDERQTAAAVAASIESNEK